MPHLLALLLATASAQEGAPPAEVPVEAAPAPAEIPVEAAPEPDAPMQAGYEEALRVVDRLIAEERWVEARVLLNWLRQPEVPEDVRQRAETRLGALPSAADAAARIRLLPWQTVAGAWLMGPNFQWIQESRGNFQDRPLLVYLGGVAGGIGGAAASLLYHRDTALTHGQVTSIVHAQQLGVVNGAWIALLVPRPSWLEYEDWAYAGWGVLGGAIAGSAGGYALADLPLDEGALSTARTGAVWGPGLTLLTMIAVDPEGEFWNDEPGHDFMPFVLAADLGTVAGYFAGEAAGFRRVDAQLTLIGGLAGAAAGFGLAAATDDMVLWSETGVASVTEVFALGGGVVGWLLARGVERPLPPVAGTALLSGTDEAPVLALPLPTVSRTRDGYAAHVQLVDLRF